jgi:uncharacterized protein (DUF1697 family)
MAPGAYRPGIPGTRQIVLLRGVNLGPRNRVAMPALRDLLAGAGFEDVRTYVQSGNVVLSSDAPPGRLAGQVRRLIAEGFGLELDVVVRTRDELAEVVRRDPLSDVATDPRRYQVSFLSGELAPEAMRELEKLAAESERLVAIGRELYAWHPEGIGRSRLWARLAGRELGVPATARNWTTVQKLLAMADE